MPTEHGKSFGSSGRARWYIHGVPDPMDVPSSPGVGDRPGRRCGHAVSMGVIASEARWQSGLEVKSGVEVTPWLSKLWTG